MTMVKQGLESRKKTKTTKLNNGIELKLDYNSVDQRDVYGFYLTNRTTKNNPKQLPDIGSFVEVYPDYLALESEPGKYHCTNKTAICWFLDDSKFDTIDGLYNAIIYRDIELLKYYKSRYLNVKYFINIDFSIYGDFDEETIVHNLKKASVVYLWLTLECEAIVYPLMTYSNEKSLEWCFENIMVGSNVAVSLKGICKNSEKALFKKALKKLIDTRKPKALIVYSVAQNVTAYDLLSYATLNEVKIIIVDNTLRSRNLREVKP